MAITSFSGGWRVLSNFYPSHVVMDGHNCRTVEHAFQAAKTLDECERHGILMQQTPGGAKKAGRAATRRGDWDAIKIEVMEGLLRQKFSKPFYRELLLSTGDQELVEGNTWGDVFWGVCQGVGENHLGKLLMKIRLELRDGATV